MALQGILCELPLSARNGKQR